MERRCNWCLVRAKGTFEPEIAKRVLLEQGMEGFVAQLEKAGAL